MRSPNTSSTRSLASDEDFFLGGEAIQRLVLDRCGRKWCLFLDRDGVINRQVVNDYVRSVQEFEWSRGAQLAIRELGDWAPFIVVVTNQQGIGKGLMTADDVRTIHEKLQSDLSETPLINAFQVCPHLQSAGCTCRKPNPGLVTDWLRAHPDVDPSLSVVVGDSQSDLDLARNVAKATGTCVGVHIRNANNPEVVNELSFDSLLEFARAIGDIRRGLGEP
jgi:histidinol-phosphate phosphatase family protein